MQFEIDKICIFQTSWSLNYYLKKMSCMNFKLLTWILSSKFLSLRTWNFTSVHETGFAPDQSFRLFKYPI